MAWTTLIDADTLADHLGRQDLVLLDGRFGLAVNGSDGGASEAAYRAGHLPGAHFAHLERDLSDMTQVPAHGRHPWPRADLFAARLAAWGIGPDTQVVAYDAGDGLFAARLWCLLRLAGHANVAVLDGGLAAWQGAGYPLTTEVPVAHTGAPRPLRFDRTRLLSAEEVAAHVAEGGVLVDARAPERFRGEVEPLDRVAGHVPGAVNRPFAQNLQEGRFKPGATLFAEFAALLGGRTASDLVAMCGSGVTACHHLLAMAHAGLEGGRLYADSWSGWTADPTRPLAVGG